MVKTWSR